MHTAFEKLAETLAKVDGAYAPNTIRAYDADMREFIGFCDSVASEAIPAAPITVASFINSLLDVGIKSATVRRKISCISAIHRWSNLPDPTKHLEVTIAIRKMHRKLGRQSKQAFGITSEILVRLYNVTGPDIRGVRDRALLLLASDTLRRRAELVSIRIEDISPGSSGGGTIYLRRSKTDQEGTGRFIRVSQRTWLAVQDWINQANIQEGFLLRGVRNNGMVNKCMCDGQVARIFRQLAKSAGLDEKVVKEISGHSLRVGGAQDLLRSGASLPQIMAAGGWTKTETVMRYVERAQ